MTIRIEPQTEAALTELAELRNVSVDRLLSDFATKEKRYLQEYAEDKAELDAMKTGDYISDKDMFAKMHQLEEQARRLADDAEQ